MRIVMNAADKVIAQDSNIPIPPTGTSTWAQCPTKDLTQTVTTQPGAVAIQIEQGPGTETQPQQAAVDQPAQGTETEFTGQSHSVVVSIEQQETLQQEEEEIPTKSCCDYGLSGCFKFDKRERSNWLFDCEGRGCFWVAVNSVLHILLAILALPFILVALIIAKNMMLWGCIPWYTDMDRDWEIRRPFYYCCND
ncbi:uncharacterized protein LOC116617660 isoform X2 [Nematostella vectensis]|nr:uncharacterized protein LOC116617660 isoform X2 [Nematostella vectensis]XP_032236480.2 uncharacterized protein LOC116617660 isoform X2 [Nematostella vectensis]XP_048583043.1 uncharacterized protein LOC116617660 isoform X2 [Nematostella vectensis]XP_048583044.1 uncharacterized protein LOC116617660 isoform X2 [Nematostella vectensis]